jgi:hypothetical protein
MSGQLMEIGAVTTKGSFTVKNISMSFWIRHIRSERLFTIKLCIFSMLIVSSRPEILRQKVENYKTTR